MESYRQTLYRYSTGSGFSPTIDVPEKASDVAAFQMVPLVHTLINAEIVVDLKREADRLSMQYEEGVRQAKLLGYDPGLGKRLKLLKKRVDLISKLMFNFPIRYVLRVDLEKMYDLYANNLSIDSLTAKASAYNQNPEMLDAYMKTTSAGSKALKVNVGSSQYDSFGRVLGKRSLEQWGKSGASLFSGYGDVTLISGLTKFAILAVGLLILIKVFNK